MVVNEIIANENYNMTTLSNCATIKKSKGRLQGSDTMGAVTWSLGDINKRIMSVI